MFGPLKYILYFFLTILSIYIALLVMPSFFEVSQIEVEEEIELPEQLG